MKTKFACLVFALILGIGSAFATVPDSASIKMQPAKEIKAAIGYPAFAIDQGVEGTVYVRLVILEDGSVNILEAHCSNNDLLRFVVDKVIAMKFDPSEYETGEPFNMRFAFSLY